MAYINPARKVLDPSKPVADKDVPAKQTPGNDMREHATHNPNGYNPKPSSKVKK